MSDILASSDELWLTITAEPDAAVDAALASPTVVGVAATLEQSATGPADTNFISEPPTATPRTRGESVKRRKRSRRPGDLR